MPNTPKKKCGRKPGGVREFVRNILRRSPQTSTPKLREKARGRFGDTEEIDRYFPQLVYEIRKELKIKVAS